MAWSFADALFNSWVLLTHLLSGTCIVQLVLNEYCPIKGRVNLQSISFPVFDAIGRSWLGSTAIGSCLLCYIDNITELIDNLLQNSGSRFSSYRVPVDFTLGICRYFFFGNFKNSFVAFCGFILKLYDCQYYN